jgi:hypothetical protein
MPHIIAYYIIPFHNITDDTTVITVKNIGLAYNVFVARFFRVTLISTLKCPSSLPLLEFSMLFSHPALPSHCCLAFSSFIVFLIFVLANIIVLI